MEGGGGCIISAKIPYSDVFQIIMIKHINIHSAQNTGIKDIF